MLFSDPSIVSLLNAYCITCTINVFPSDPRDGVDPADAAWIRQNAPDVAYLLSESIRLGPALIAPDWKHSERVFMVHQTEMKQASMRAITEAAKTYQVEKGAPRVRPSVPKPAELQADDLLVRVTARFLTKETLERPVEIKLPAGRPFRVPLDAMHGADNEVRSMYELRLRKPLATRDWIVLKPGQVSALLPQVDIAIGGSWNVDPTVATELLWLFRPSTHQFRISRDDVKSVRLRATRVSADEVRLEGAVRIRQYWFPTSNEGIWRGDLLVDDYWAETAVSGYLRFNEATRRITTLRLSSDDAMYRGIDNTQLPYAVVAYSVDPTRVDHEELAMQR